MIEEKLKHKNMPENQKLILKRVIHTTADFDYIENLKFSEHAVEIALQALKNGASIITDTNMALAGIHKKSLHALGGKAYCFMADSDVAEQAKTRGITRAMASMEKACNLKGDLIFAIGNAPTALYQLIDLIQEK
ncbi:MAG: precorrin-8X methylmutase, partial [Oscillospiraceae bacterium]|nr:precorrin-8X methylmutase [Oscillospiraceae bacterium]